MATITGTGAGTLPDDIGSGTAELVTQITIQRVWFLRTTVQEIINISDPDYAVDEADGSVEITYVRTNPRDLRSVQFNVVTTPGTATQGVNYLNAPSPVVIPDGETVISQLVTILDAGLAGGQTRTFTVSLGVPPSHLAYRRGSLSKATITING